MDSTLCREVEVGVGVGTGNWLQVQGRVPAVGPVAPGTGQVEHIGRTGLVGLVHRAGRAGLDSIAYLWLTATGMALPQRYLGLLWCL